MSMNTGLSANLRVTIINLLRGYQTAKLKPFTIAGRTLKLQYFLDLADAVENGSVKAQYDPSKNGKGEYDSDSNTFFLGFSVAANLYNKALIIHEAVHAILDMRQPSLPKNKAAMLIKESEAAAYIAQCQFFYANCIYTGRQLYAKAGVGSKDDEVFKRAWAIGEKIYDNYLVNPKEYIDLIAATAGHSKYSEKANQSAKFNGI